MWQLPGKALSLFQPRLRRAGVLRSRGPHGGRSRARPARARLQALLCRQWLGLRPRKAFLVLEVLQVRLQQRTELQNMAAGTSAALMEAASALGAVDIATSAQEAVHTSGAAARSSSAGAASAGPAEPTSAAQEAAAAPGTGPAEGSTGLPSYAAPDAAISAEHAAGEGATLASGAETAAVAGAAAGPTGRQAAVAAAPGASAAERPRRLQVTLAEQMVRARSCLNLN